LPGETATVRWLVAAPEPDPALGWALAACSAAPPGGALPECAEAPFASAAQDDPVPGEPAITFAVPDPPSASWLAVTGVVCPGGCSASPGTPVSLDFALGTADEINSNPSLGAEGLLLDGAPWPEGSDDCSLLPQVAPGSKHALELVLDDADRDALPQATSVDPAYETLQLSHFVTAGELERAFSVLPGDEPGLRAKVSWKAPSAATLVRFFLVVRDLRGGSDWALRALCVAP
jgi:hypothetical protein